MSVSILHTLSMLPTGELGIPLDHNELGKYLREEVNTVAEVDRQARHKLRDELYRDGGVAFMEQVIDQQFQHPKTRDKRKKLVKHARFNNALKRIVRELSTVYQEPAKRTVANATDATYQELLKRVQMDEVAPESNRQYNLHRTLLWGYRVRVLPDGRRQPVIDLWTPTNVRAIVHPNDATYVIGWLLRVHSKPARGTDRRPSWAMWTDHERALLTEEMLPVPGTWVQHGYKDLDGTGICPVVPISAFPTPPGFWPGEEGEDLVSAAIAIWLINTLLVKETKSSTRQTVLTGDTTAMLRDQAIESEEFLEAPDGVGVSQNDATVDPDIFTVPVDHILEGAGNNYGLSMTLLKHQGVQSAEARDLMRLPLRERRDEQRIPFRRAEQQLARVMAAVNRVEMPELAFDPAGWRIDFGEGQTPLTEGESLDLHLKRRSAGLDNPVDYLLRQNPDLTQPIAEVLIQRNVKVMTWWNRIMREMQAISGSQNARVDAPEEGDGDEDTSEETIQ